MAEARDGGARRGWRRPASRALAGRPAGVPFLSSDQKGGGCALVPQFTPLSKQRGRTKPGLPVGFSLCFKWKWLMVSEYLFMCLFIRAWITKATGGGGAVQGSREWARGRHHICLPASRSHSPSRLCLSRGWGEPSRLPPAPASWSPTPAPAGWPGSWPGRQNQNGLLWPDDTPEPASCSVTGARLPSPKASSPSSSSVRWRWEPLASPSLPPPPPGPAQPPAPGGTLALPLNGHVTSQGPSHR